MNVDYSQDSWLDGLANLTRSVSTAVVDVSRSVTDVRQAFDTNNNRALQLNQAQQNAAAAAANGNNTAGAQTLFNSFGTGGQFGQYLRSPQGQLLLLGVGIAALYYLSKSRA